MTWRRKRTSREGDFQIQMDVFIKTRAPRKRLQKCFCAHVRCSCHRTSLTPTPPTPPPPFKGANLHSPTLSTPFHCTNNSNSPIPRARAHIRALLHKSHAFSACFQHLRPDPPSTMNYYPNFQYTHFHFPPPPIPPPLPVITQDIEPPTSSPLERHMAKHGVKMTYQKKKKTATKRKSKEKPILYAKVPPHCITEKALEKLNHIMTKEKFDQLKWGMKHRERKMVRTRRLSQRPIIQKKWSPYSRKDSHKFSG